jgi:hypothetical protein
MEESLQDNSRHHNHSEGDLHEGTQDNMIDNDQDQD